MKRVICPKCKNATIQMISGDTVIPLNYDSEEETDENITNNTTPTDTPTSSAKKELFHLSKKMHYTFQCYSCGATFSKKM